MTAPTSRDRAFHVIANMTSEWQTTHYLAKQARLTVRTMVRYLVQAKKHGLLENRMLNGKYGSRIHKWHKRETHETNSENT